MVSHTNKLIDENSPYLLQHAHNPVDWYPWSEEALGIAREKDMPILVSIGYSACHWCHVMERESFENEATAAFMNQHFINIKIDREERPDLDHIYMDAVQAIAGNGGWPLNVFLTPDRKPFYGGTYFPPERAFNRASWKEVLTGVSNLFKDKRKEVEEQAEELTRHIEQANGIAQTKLKINDVDNEHFNRIGADSIFETIMKQADKVWGGFGDAPKFPQTFVINYLLRYHHYTGNIDALQQATLSLDKMIEGGMYDQLGGGFARYSTDREWLAPHFEKMLYDNALLISTLCDAYQLTQNELYRSTVEETITFLQRELTDDSGGFYAALDADSEGVEGKFYVWSHEEVKTILGEDADDFCKYYDITPEGNWEHSNILRRLVSIPPQNVKRSAQTLLTEREKRIRPGLDDKIILGWNALMTVALSKAAAAFSNDSYKQMAIKNFKLLSTAFRKEGSGFELLHTFKNGVAKYPAFLDDYAAMIQACIALQEITSEPDYLEFADGLMQFVLNNFKSDNGYFYYTSAEQSDVIVRKTELYDGAVPSGNSMMAFNLMHLGTLLDKKVWIDNAHELVAGLQDLISKYPSSFGNWAALMIDLSAGINEIVVLGTGYEDLRDQMLLEFIPNRVVQSAETASSSYPLMKGKSSTQYPVIYVCREYACHLPSLSKNEAVKQIVKKI